MTATFTLDDLKSLTSRGGGTSSDIDTSDLVSKFNGEAIDITLYGKTQIKANPDWVVGDNDDQNNLEITGKTQINGKTKINGNITFTEPENVVFLCKNDQTKQDVPITALALINEAYFNKGSSGSGTDTPSTPSAPIDSKLLEYITINEENKNLNVLGNTTFNFTPINPQSDISTHTDEVVTISDIFYNIKNTETLNKKTKYLKESGEIEYPTIDGAYFKESSHQLTFVPKANFRNGFIVTNNTRNVQTNSYEKIFDSDEIKTTIDATNQIKDNYLVKKDGEGQDLVLKWSKNSSLIQDGKATKLELDDDCKLYYMYNNTIQSPLTVSSVINKILALEGRLTGYNSDINLKDATLSDSLSIISGECFNIKYNDQGILHINY